MQKNKKNVRFVRIRGRIVPMAMKREAQVAGEIGSKKNRGSLAQIAGAGAVGAGGLYGAGRLHRQAMKVGSSKMNRVAKIGKFGVAFGVGALMANAITKIDKKTADEKSRVMNIGSQARTGAGHLAKFALAYGAYRVGKRFEYAGKLGVNLLSKKGIKKMKNLKAI